MIIKDHDEFLLRLRIPEAPPGSGSEAEEPSAPRFSTRRSVPPDRYRSEVATPKNAKK